MSSVRPTKKQRELLEFIAALITRHGFSPTYREIMSGCDYNSVGTVAMHVNSLIRRGHLRKRENSARSLEVVDEVSEQPALTRDWLLAEIDKRFDQPDTESLEKLVDALEVLALPEAADYRQRYNALVAKTTTLSGTDS